MLNPDVQRKGGFGAFAERGQDRRTGRAADVATDSPAAPGPASPPAAAERTGTTHRRASIPAADRRFRRSW
jgi:hypothetical protein